MIVSNTTSFIALCAADCLDIFPQVLGHIHVAESVVVECRAGGQIVVPDLAALAWVTVHCMPIETHPRLWMLDVGERDTIELAMKLSAKRVVIDERIGRNIAEYKGWLLLGHSGCS
jgi:predicted nucleic acid-binding protein